MRKKKKIKLSSVLVFGFLLILLIIILYPMIWTILSSFKSTQDIYNTMWGLPTVWKFENYKIAWEKGISKYLLNSVFVTGCTIFLTLILSSMCAFSLSRYNYKFLSPILLFCMGGMMVSPQVCLIPLYQLLQSLGIHNTHLALILPYTAFRAPLIILLIRAYFLSIPKEISESAEIDGCSSLQVYLRIFLPMAKPVLLTSIIQVAFYAWNEFLFTTIFIDSDSLRTIPSGLMSFKDALIVDWGPILAGMVLSVIPIALVFILMQKHFVKGMNSGAVKG